jgi:hypothetical protein
MLGSVESALIEELVDCYYGGCGNESKAPYINYIGASSSEANPKLTFATVLCHAHQPQGSAQASFGLPSTED